MSAIYAQDLKWPVKGEIDLFSNFCDFRPLHFHGGIDIRTGAKEGREVFSPADGYIWRIKYAYLGYGKGLYIKDKQGFIYVFGHLSRLSEKLEKLVKDLQFSRKRYFFDETYDPGEISVSAGELIGYSGQTGYGGPHIHFEKRTADNKPLNPMTNGFDVEDHTSPEIESFALIYTDSGSFFPDGSRRAYFKPESGGKKGGYLIKKPVIVKGDFGVEVKSSDRIRPGGPKLNIYRARLFIDDYLYYDVVYEEYDYAQTAMVDLSFDYELVINKQSYWHLLFNPPGKEYEGARSLYREGGIYSGQTEFKYGLHHGRVEIFDAAGNLSELNFDFMVVPPGNLFNIEWVSDSMFYMSGQSDNRHIDIKGISVYGGRGGDKWRKFSDQQITTSGRGGYKVSLSPENKKSKIFKIVVEGQSGWEITDSYIIPATEKDCRYTLNYSLSGNGILFIIKSPQKYAPPPRLEIIYEDGYVKSQPVKQIAPNKFAAFYRDTRISSKIIRFDLYDAKAGSASISREVNLALAGTGLDNSRLSYSDDFMVTYTSDCFYEPTFIDIYREKAKYRYSKNTVSNIYSVRPNTVPLAEDIELSFKLDKAVDKSRVGIFRLNKKKEWKWLDSEISGDFIKGKSSLMGTFAVLKDHVAPKVKKIYPPMGKTVFTPYPRISCTITDGLAQIKNDDNIELLLDGRWLIPEYDPETFRLKAYPNWPLKKGRHELALTVSDRLGNERKVFSHFFVSEKNEKK